MNDARKEIVREFVVGLLGICLALLLGLLLLAAYAAVVGLNDGTMNSDSPAGAQGPLRRD